MSEKEQPKPPEVIKAEREQTPMPTLDELTSFAEFDAERFRKAAEKTTNEKVKPNLQAEAQAKKEVKQILQTLKERNITRVDDVLEKLITDVRSAERQPSIPDFLKKQIKVQNRAIDFLVKNRDARLDTRADFQSWRQEKMTVQARRTTEQQTARAQTARADIAKRIEEVYQEMGVESPEARERELEEVIKLINQESAKVVLAPLTIEEWQKAGRKERLLKGYSEGVAGKKLVGLDPDKSDGPFIDFTSSRNLAAPENYDLPEKPSREYITYRIRPDFGQKIFEKRPVEETIKVPGRFWGTNKEKRTVTKDVEVGRRTMLMKDRVVGGNDRESYSVSFRRAAQKDSEGVRGADIIITAIVPKEVAERVSDVLRNNPKAADRLFEAIQPDWLKAVPDIHYKPSKHIGGELLPSKKKS